MRRATKWMWVRFHAHTTSLKSPRLSSLAVCLEERTSFCCKTRVTLEKSTVKVPARERERAPFPQTQRHFCLSTLSTWPKKANLAVKSRKQWFVWGYVPDIQHKYCSWSAQQHVFIVEQGARKLLHKTHIYTWCIVGYKSLRRKWIHCFCLSFLKKIKF